jgi:hypothetical protein
LRDRYHPDGKVLSANPPVSGSEPFNILAGCNVKIPGIRHEFATAKSSAACTVPNKGRLAVPSAVDAENCYYCPCNQ